MTGSTPQAQSYLPSSYTNSGMCSITIQQADVQLMNRALLQRRNISTINKCIVVDHHCVQMKCGAAFASHARHLKRSPASEGYADVLPVKAACCTSMCKYYTPQPTSVWVHSAVPFTLLIFQFRVKVLCLISASNNNYAASNRT